MASISGATPTWSTGPDVKMGAELASRHVSNHISSRRPVSCSPKTPHNPIPSPPIRHKTCYVRSHNDGVTDDSKYIIDALRTCNYGGHVVFKEDTKYLIGTALDLTFLNHIDLGINGTIRIYALSANS